MMTKGDAFDLYVMLINEMLRREVSPAFAFVIIRNIPILKTVHDEIMVLGRVPESYQKFEQVRIALCTTHAVKGEDGVPLTTGEVPNQEYVIKDRKLFDSALDALREVHADSIQERDDVEAQVNAERAKPANLALEQVVLATFPQKITPREMILLRWLVKGEQTLNKTGTIRRGKKPTKKKK
ncbi:MAG: hypothetical protein GY869_17275, partial [Planctomycetes bacterium]|nr:hypothetical protein [Planctomycetota bacterium]